MIPLEQEMRDYLNSRNIPYEDNCRSGTRLDFSVSVKTGGLIHIELKEKLRHTKMSNWRSVDIPEKDLYILDDLSARKVLLHAPLAGLIIRNNTTGYYYWLDVVTLFMMPKIRTDRVVNEAGHRKGKIMLDMRMAKMASGLSGALRHVSNYLKDQQNLFKYQTACYPVLPGEHIPVGGELRTAEQKQFDLNSTTRF